jgi:hypothetical protein
MTCVKFHPDDAERAPHATVGTGPRGSTGRRSDVCRCRFRSCGDWFCWHRLFRHGRYPGGSIPVWSVDRNGRVDIARSILRLSEAEALALTVSPAGSNGRDRSRIQICLSLYGHGPDRPRHLVGQRGGHQHTRLTLQHPGEPRSFADRPAPDPVQPRHRSADHKLSNVGLTCLRTSVQALPAACRVLPRNAPEPGRAVAPGSEALHRGGEGFDGQCRYRPARDSASSIAAVTCPHRVVQVEC